MTILIIIYLTCSSICLFIGFSILLNNSRQKFNRWFFIVCMNLSFWALMLSFMTAAKDAETVALYRRLTTFSWSTVFSGILYVTIFLVKKENFFKKIWSYILVFSPAVLSTYLYYSQPLKPENFVKTGFGWIIEYPETRGILRDYFFNFYYVIFTAIIILLFINWGKNTEFEREKKQSKIIVYSIIVAFILGTITDVILPNLGFVNIPELSIITNLIVVLSIWYAVIKYSFMSLNIENIVVDVFKIMNEGLIILDSKKIIVDINQGALELLGYEENEIKGKNIEIIFSNKQETDKIETLNSYEIDLLSKNYTNIPVLLSSSILDDGWGGDMGRLIIFQNHCEIRKMQNKLKEAYNGLEKRVNQRTIELKEVNAQLENEIQGRIQKEEEIKKLAFNDQLTGLANRKCFADQVNERIFESSKHKKTFSILLIDLDSFKMINDTIGYEQGEKLLIKVSERLKGILRSNDIIARATGDQFLILIEDYNCNEDIEKKCEYIINKIKEPYQFNNSEIYITASIGASIYPHHGIEAEKLLNNADIAMYKAKEKGKGRFVFFDSLMKKNLDEVMNLTNDLYRALEFNELEVYYQPQINIKSSKIVGLEALLRWNHPKLGIVSPNIFIPIAEKTGLIVSIGEWVLNTACRQVKQWQEAGVCNLSIAVNLSVNQIQSNKIVEQVSKILAETELNPEDLELEITENVLMKDTNFVVDTLKELKQLDIRIAIDDFGTEYSSLNYLKQLPLDRIKIAKCFVDGIDKNINDEAIISAIILLGKKLKLNVIAEGIEEERQQIFLKAQMCDEIQGFYYYKPMPAMEIEKILKKSNN